MSVASQPTSSQQDQHKSAAISDRSQAPAKQEPVFVSTLTAEETSSPEQTSSDSFRAPAIQSEFSKQPKLKSILDNPNDVLPCRASRSGSESGFKAALKATFLPPPTPGRQVKLKDGRTLGRSFQRTEPRSTDFEGGEVLDYDPRGKNASAGDGILPTVCLYPPSTSPVNSTSGSGYGSDKDSGLSTPSETDESADYSHSYTSETNSAMGSSTNTSSERGRPAISVPSRAREGSMASTTSSSSGAAIRFCPLPVSGRLKRANSITIGVAARSHLLQSQGSAAPLRPSYAPHHVHGSQSWYTNAGHNANAATHLRHADVVDVGEEIKKGASKAWKFIRGGGASTSDSSGGKAKQVSDSSNAVQTKAAQSAMFDQPKKAFPKEGAPVADPETGELKMADGSALGSSSEVPNGRISDSAKKLPAADSGPQSGDHTPRRAISPTAQLQSMSISEDPEAEEAAAALEAAHANNAAKQSRRPNGHHPHELCDGPQHNTFHLADEHDTAHLDSGAATPRSGIQRRLSTGAFLRGLSIRGIQEDRRRDLLGLDQDGEPQQSNSAELASDEKTSGEHNRHGIAVRTPAGKEEELGLEGYGHSRQSHS